MARTLVTIDDRLIDLPPRLAAMVRLLIRYEKTICPLDTCVVEFHCGKTSGNGKHPAADVRVKLVVPLGERG